VGINRCTGLICDPCRSWGGLLAAWAQGQVARLILAGRVLQPWPLAACNHGGSDRADAKGANARVAFLLLRHQCGGGWDVRKECLIAATPGVVHFVSQDPYHDFWSSTEQSLQYFRELVKMEGPDSIAGVIIETIAGATGVVQPAPEYLQGVQAICREHGIMLIADEVMSGFCRTGKWFGFEHASLSPDIVTMAKGITGAAVPLGAVAVTEKIAACFQDKMLPCGSTYNAHPVSLAAASAAIKLYDTLDILNHMESLRPTIADRRAKLLKHASCFDARFVGLHGCVEVRLPEEGVAAAIEAAKAMMLERGLWSLVRLNTNTQRLDILSSPPLIVTADKLNFAFDILEEVLGSMDQKR